MRIHEFVDEGLGHSSYLVDLGGETAVLDAEQDRADLVRQCLDVGHEHLVGASLLERRGRHDVVVLDGGPDTWSNETGRPLESGS